jgi:uncharacterized protein
MREELPKFIDPRRLVEQAGTLAGSVAPARLRRVVAPFAATHPVMVTVEVTIDDIRRPRITGRVETEIDATCQRCLGPMSVTIEQEIDVVLVEGGTDAADDEDEILDVVEFVDGRFDIEQFVEDEVLLACPMIPMHEGAGCHASPRRQRPENAARKRPFAGLAEMLAANDKGGSGR